MTSDSPNNNWSYLINVAHDNSYVGNQYQFQIAASFSNELNTSFGPENYWVRTINPTGIGSWKTLWHSGNFQSSAYLPLSGGTLSGTLYFANNQSIQATMADNDFWRIYGGNTGSNNGYLEIATADDGTEPIYFRQYNNGFITPLRTLTLLDANGNSFFPGNISCNIISATNNGNGTNIYVGDDAIIGDVNTANTLSVKGGQNNSIGYIKFGSNSNTFGYDGTKMSYASNMYYGGSLSANSFVKNGGTASQILLGNGTTDNVDRFVQGNGSGDFGTRTTNYLVGGSIVYQNPMKSGFYDTSSSDLVGSTSWSFLINAAYSGSNSIHPFQFQIASTFSNDALYGNAWGPEVYAMRVINERGIGSWRTLLHDGNFTSYITGRYLPLSAGSGNALTGDLYTNNGIVLNNYYDSYLSVGSQKQIVSVNGDSCFRTLELTYTGCGNVQIYFHNNVYLGGVTYQTDFSTTAYGPSNAIVVKGFSDPDTGGLFFGSVPSNYYIGRLPGENYITVSKDTFIRGDLIVNSNITANKLIIGNFVNNTLTTTLDYILDSVSTYVSMIIMNGAGNKRLYFPPSYNTTYISGRVVYFHNSSSSNCFITMQYPLDYFLNLTTNTSPNSITVLPNEMYMCICINQSPTYWTASKVG